LFPIPNFAVLGYASRWCGSPAACETNRLRVLLEWPGDDAARSQKMTHEGRADLLNACDQDIVGGVREV